jgi:serine/threonine protein kinase
VVDNRPSWVSRGGHESGTSPKAAAKPVEEEEEIEWDEDEEDEETKAARLIAERRAKRKTIMEKYKGGEPAAAVSAATPAAQQNQAPPAEADASGAGGAEPGGVASASATGTAGLTAADGRDGPEEDNDMFGDEFEAGDGLLEGQDRLIDDVDAGLEEDAKDEEGYYSARSGDMFCKGRYQVVSAVGRGVFSSVLCAKDTHRFDAEVAIKVIRSNEVMSKLAQKELTLLEELRANDPEDRKHVVKLLDHFKHKGHLCFVFEKYDANLRDVIKKYGKGVGINITAVRSYGKQMLIALAHMAKCSIMHADIKPDNMLVNKARNIVKICDLGSASKTDECEITPYLVSRFYRAPEIILGHKYDNSIDLWSVACCLYELYTGKYLFPGRDNNQMLKHIQDVCGPFSTKMLRKSMFRELHYTDEMMFVSKEKDPVKKTFVFRNIKYVGPTKDLFKMLCPDPDVFEVDELRRIQLLKDILDKMLVLDPSKRISVKDALNHPFFTTKG